MGMHIVWVGSSTQDIQADEYSKHVHVSMHLVHPCHGSLLPSTVHNASALVNIIQVHIDGHALSISVKPGSATHVPTSTASIGLQHLSVGACVHLVWFRAASFRMWLPSCANILHASQLLASTVSEAPDRRCHRRRWQNEKCLAPMCLDMPIFKSTDPNVDVMYTLWRLMCKDGWTNIKRRV